MVTDTTLELSTVLFLEGGREGERDRVVSPA
jgi:hypothetical protein